MTEAALIVTHSVASGGGGERQFVRWSILAQVTKDTPSGCTWGSQVKERLSSFR